MAANHTQRPKFYEEQYLGRGRSDRCCGLRQRLSRRVICWARIRGASPSDWH